MIRREIKKMVLDFSVLPETISAYFAAKLDRLARVLIVLTSVLAFLTLINIVILIMQIIRC